MDIEDTIAQLTAERDGIDKALEALKGLGGSTPQPTPAVPVQRRTARSSGTAGKLALTPENVLSLTTKDGVPATVVRAGVKA